MIIRVFDDNNSLAGAAASQAAAAIRSAIALRGRARIVAATGASQFAFLEALTATPGIDWKRVELFHLDEYIDLPMNHPASFCKYLQQRLIGKTGITNCHLMKGDANPAEVIRLTSEAILQAPIDVSFVGIGENGHLAFNDPPADFHKAAAVQACIEGDIRPLAPASILRTHPNTTIYLDRSSAGLLTADTLSAFAASSR